MTGSHPVIIMPSKNSIKTYIEDSYYHVYNRGVEKRNIFLDEKDYHVFLNLMKIYLSPVPNATSQLMNMFPDKRIRVRKTFKDELEILSFCLMPNHFHLLIHQNTPQAMPEFMRALSTSYSMYFNKRYRRVGSLFQGVYKAVNISNDEYLLHLSRYIHRNPLKLTGWNPVTLSKYRYSSFSTYLNAAQRPWINSKFILNYFSNASSPILKYKEFVEMIDNDSTPVLNHLIIEDPVE